MVVGVQLKADSLLKEIWQAHWASNIAGDVADTILYPRDAWIVRKYFGDHDHLKPRRVAFPAKLPGLFSSGKHFPGIREVWRFIPHADQRAHVTARG